MLITMLTGDTRQSVAQQGARKLTLNVCNAPLSAIWA